MEIRDDGVSIVSTAILCPRFPQVWVMSLDIFGEVPVLGDTAACFPFDLEMRFGRLIMAGEDLTRAPIIEFSSTIQFPLINGASLGLRYSISALYQAFILYAVRFVLGPALILLTVRAFSGCILTADWL